MSIAVEKMNPTVAQFIGYDRRTRYESVFDAFRQEVQNKNMNGTDADAKIECNFAKAKSLIERVLLEYTDGRFGARYCQYGNFRGEALYKVGDVTNPFEYWAVVTNGINGNDYTVWVNLPARVTKIRDDMSEEMMDTLIRHHICNPDQYRQDMMELAKKAVASLLWKRFRYIFVSREENVLTCGPGEKVEELTCPGSDIKAALVHPAEDQIAKPLLKIFIPGFALERRPELTEELLGKYHIQLQLAKIISSQVSKKIGKDDIKPLLPISEYGAFCRQLRSAPKVIGGNMAREDGGASKTPDSEVAAFIVQSRNGYELYMFIPKQSTGLI